MEVGEASGGGQRQWPVVYVHGYKHDARQPAWCCVDVGSMLTDVESMMTKGDSLQGKALKRWRKKMRKQRVMSRAKISTVAALPYDTRGGYTIIGEDIYWYGAFYTSGHKNTMRLVKHNTKLVEANRSVWEELSRSTDFTNSKISVLSGGRKMCVFFFLEVKNRILTLRGKIYDLYDHTWDNLECRTTFDYVDHRKIVSASVVENENGSEQTQILFYDVFWGSVMFLDLASRELRCEADHRSLCLRPCDANSRPLGLEMCSNIVNLRCTSAWVPAVLSDNTLYWFTPDLHLYGYDINLRRWFQSPSLATKLPTLEPLDLSYNHDIFPPVLADLGNKNFLVLVPEGDNGEFTVAVLGVYKGVDTLTLTVSVKGFQSFLADDGYFSPNSVMMAMLKKPRPGTTHKPL